MAREKQSDFLPGAGAAARPAKPRDRRPRAIHRPAQHHAFPCEFFCPLVSAPADIGRPGRIAAAVVIAAASSSCRPGGVWRKLRAAGNTDGSSEGYASASQRPGGPGMAARRAGRRADRPGRGRRRCRADRRRRPAAGPRPFPHISGRLPRAWRCRPSRPRPPSAMRSRPASRRRLPARPSRRCAPIRRLPPPNRQSAPALPS